MTENGLRSILNHVVTIIPKPQFFLALKSSFLLIFLATLFYRLIDQFTTKQIEGLIRSSDGISSVVWGWAGLSLVLSILFPTLLAVISLYALRNNSLKRFGFFLRNHLELSILETLRAWGISILWGFLFIIPGLIKMSYYYLTTFVVLFSPEYARGEVDALKKSAEISKRHWGILNLSVTVFYFVIPILVSTIFDEYTVFEKHPFFAAAFCGVEAVTVLLFHYFVLKLFFNEFMTPPDQGELHVAYV